VPAWGRPLRRSLHLRTAGRDRLLSHVTPGNDALLDPAYRGRLPLDADLSTVRLRLHQLLRRVHRRRVRHHDDHDDDREHDDQPGNDDHEHADLYVSTDHCFLLRWFWRLALV